MAVLGARLTVPIQVFESPLFCFADEEEYHYECEDVEGTEMC